MSPFESGVINAATDERGSIRSIFVMEPPAKIGQKGSDDNALKVIAEGVESEIGEGFFSSLARNLALALGVQYAFVTRLSDDGIYFRTLALWERDHFGKDVELPLRGSPCELVLHGQTAHYPTETMRPLPPRSFAGRMGRAELLRCAGVR